MHTRIAGRPTAPATLTTLLASVPPTRLYARADDPDNLDVVYSSGDTVTIGYDRATDRAGGAEGDGEVAAELPFTRLG